MHLLGPWLLLLVNGLLSTLKPSTPGRGPASGSPAPTEP
ncbi:CD22 isoform 5 [Pan troglodytes]|uniref:CD22 isoform 4 n=2 Tax=Hominidae TaxID=9604 RepID=A0A2J8RRD7_PONAB|nr:CD22 isoform 5 [Pan troglodytes]PNJ11084.1 CD22 isoform 4 [Pongo abelii]